MTLREHSLKNIYIGEYKGESLTFDFTQWTQWWTFYRTNSNHTNWQDSWWLWIGSNNDSWVSSRKMPSSLYTWKQLLKVDITFYTASTWNGWGIWELNFDNWTRIWWNWGSAYKIETFWLISSNVTTNLNVTYTWEYTFTVDLVNKVVSTSVSWTTQTLTDDNITALRNYWSNGTLWLWLMHWNRNSPSYLRNATFTIC